MKEVVAGVHQITDRLDRADGVLFVGDAALNRHGSVTRGWMNRRGPTFDVGIRRLAELEIDVACFGHASPSSEERRSTSGGSPPLSPDHTGRAGRP